MKRKYSSSSSSSGRSVRRRLSLPSPPSTGKRLRYRQRYEASPSPTDSYSRRLGQLVEDSDPSDAALWGPHNRSVSSAASSDISVGGVISAGQAVYNIATSDTPWATLGSEVGGFVGGSLGSGAGPLGSLAAGAVGSAIGSAVGSAGDAAVSYLSGSSPKENNMPKSGFAPFNSGKSSVSTKGRVKVSSSKKVVRVSKTLREKVKKVLNGARPQGVYRFAYQGFLGIKLTDSTGAAENVMNVVNTTGQTIQASRGVPAIFNAKQWYAAYAVVQTTTPAAQFFAAASVMEYFTPTKILNAASVLFNGKPMPTALDNLTTNNMLTATTTSGVVVQRPQKHTIHINNCYTVMSFKNCAGRVLIVDFYVCTMKTKTNVASGLEHITEAILADQEFNINDSNPTFKARDVTDREEIINYALTSLSFDPAMLSTFRARFKYEKITMTIQPGETLTKTIQGPRNYDIDFSKITNSNNQSVAEPALNYKPTTVVCFASVRPDLQFVTAGINDIAGESGVASAIKGILNVISCPIAIQHEEVFDLAMPENTGFVINNVQPGGHQTLDHRFTKKRIYLNDRRLAAGQGTTAYTTVNEENPSVNNSITSGNILY